MLTATAKTQRERLQKIKKIKKNQRKKEPEGHAHSGSKDRERKILRFLERESVCV